MKVVQYFKHTRNLNAYIKKYKRVTQALMCIFILCAAFVLTTHAEAETHNLQNNTYVKYSQPSESDEQDSLQLLTTDESSTHPVYVLQDKNIKSVKVSTDKNSDGVQNGTITPNTKYLKLKVEFQNIHADTLENQYDGSFTYKLPEFFRSTSTTERPIIDKNNKQIGKIHVENGQAIVTYTKEFLASLGENATTWENGAFYWVIEVNGSAIREGTKIRDAVVKENNITDSYLHTDSIAGIYQGKLTKQIGACKNYKEFLDSNTGLVDQSKLFDHEYTNSKNFPDNNKSELTLIAKQTIKLENDENIYMIIKTEPSQIPVVNRTTFTYKNEVLLKDTTDTSFIKRNDATLSLHGGGDLLKEFNFTFSYDGKQATILKDGTDNNTSKIATNILDQTTGHGIYASWVFKVNYAGDLKGDYRVLEDIPEGMELGYIRIKWHGNKAGSVVSKTMDNLGDDWKQYSNTAINDNNQSQSTTYYYNKNINKALIKLGEFENKHTRDECSIDVQVVCRVTDSKVLLGGQSKTFANKVILQDEDGEEQLATSSSTAALEKNSLDKSHPETFNGQTIKYTITANTLSQKLPSNDGNKLTLVDELGDNLELDITSIEAKDDAGNSVDIEKAFNPKTNTLEISIPNEKKIIITYTVTVNIPPDTTSKVSNKVYWKSYGSDGGKNDVIPDFSYNLNAGGSTTTTDNPYLIIKKIDQDNANPMNGVTFDIHECKLNGDMIQRVEGITTNGQTENGVLTVKAPFITSYNTIYEVKERGTPDGYIKYDSSYYIICVDKENNDDYSDYVKQCIAYFEKQSNKKYKIAYSIKDFNLTIYNSQTGIVVKKAFINNAAGTSHKPVSGTYTFGLYDNPQGGGSPLQVKTITYSTGETEEKTTK